LLLYALPYTWRCPLSDGPGEETHKLLDAVGRLVSCLVCPDVRGSAGTYFPLVKRPKLSRWVTWHSSRAGLDSLVRIWRVSSPPRRCKLPSPGTYADVKDTGGSVGAAGHGCWMWSV